MKRIQRSRMKGWKMPPNAVYVGRPTVWGNPWTLKDATRARVLELYRSWLIQKLSNLPDFLDELRDKDLACWCRLDQSCHADILLSVISTQKQESKK